MARPRAGCQRVILRVGHESTRPGSLATPKAMALRPLDHVKHLVPMRLKALAKEAYLRGAIWKEGGTPDFLLVGVMKGGSTSLYNYLVQHPQIVPALGKEIWYLGGYNAWRGETGYRRHFIDGARKRALEE